MKEICQNTNKHKLGSSKLKFDTRKGSLQGQSGGQGDLSNNLEQYLEYKYKINVKDEEFDKRNDLIESKQIYSMLKNSSCINKENKYPIRKQTNQSRELERNSIDLTKRLSKAQLQIQIQKKRVKQLQDSIIKNNLTQQSSPIESDLKQKNYQMNKCLVNRIQQMIESIDGKKTQDLQEVWRWLKKRIEQYENLKICKQRISQLIEDKQIVRAEDITKILRFA